MSKQPYQKIPAGRSSRTAFPLASNMPPASPVLNEAQRIAAQTAVSGRRAVSRGTMFLVLYFWALAGALLFSWMARRTEFFPGDLKIIRTLQRQKNPWFRRAMIAVSAPGFPRLGVPLTIGIAGIFLALRFRLEAIFLALSGSSSLVNELIKRLIKRPRPNGQEVTVVRIINEPSFPSGHVMFYLNLFGMLMYFLATNWPGGKLRNACMAVCGSFMTLVGPSRIYLGAHWPSDVVAGYLYGGLWLGSLMALYLRIKAWIHPAVGETPEAMKPLQQPVPEAPSASS